MFSDAKKNFLRLVAMKNIFFFPCREHFFFNGARYLGLLRRFFVALEIISMVGYLIKLSAANYSLCSSAAFTATEMKLHIRVTAVYKR